MTSLFETTPIKLFKRFKAGLSRLLTASIKSRNTSNFDIGRVFVFNCGEDLKVQFEADMNFEKKELYTTKRSAGYQVLCLMISLPNISSLYTYISSLLGVDVSDPQIHDSWAKGN
jgi:hypothetical protein